MDASTLILIYIEVLVSNNPVIAHHRLQVEQHVSVIQIASNVDNCMTFFISLINHWLDVNSVFLFLIIIVSTKSDNICEMATIDQLKQAIFIFKCLLVKFDHNTDLLFTALLLHIFKILFFKNLYKCNYLN